LQLLGKIRDAVVFGNILIAAAAVCLVLESTLVLKGFIVPRPHQVLVFFATLFVYSLHRYLGTRDDSSNPSPRSQWALRNKPLIRAFIGIGIVGCGVSVLFSAMEVRVILLPLCILTLAYFMPLLKSVRLRDLPWMKTFLIAMVWTIVTVMLPAVRGDVSLLSPGFLMLSAERFLFVFAITIPFDIRDIHDDSSKGVISIAVSFGAKKSKLLALCCLLLFAVLVHLHAWLLGLSPVGFTLPMVISAVSTAFLVYKTSGRRSEYFYLLWLDGTMIAQFLLLMAFRL
jgi:4-hydroxybenzoate polyprenyltransferase